MCENGTEDTMKIIGRKAETEALKNYESSGEPELIVVYGRRRVGKTFLIKEYFNDDFFFYFTGVANENKKVHLDRFAKSLKKYGANTATVPATWMEAFDRLEELIANAPKEERKVIFFDEIPWMDTPKSHFLSALEYFWNSFASRRNDVLFIVCGSATSWLTNKLFKNRGGLHNRVTGKIHLSPFTLTECESYLKERDVSISRYDIVECYMIFGGIPYYLKYLDKRYSLSQNVDRILFRKDAPLKDEFSNLYASLFQNAERYEEVVSALGKKAKGLTRDEILASVNGTDGGRFSKALEDLELSGFIRKYYAYPGRANDALYQLIDNFTLFHQSFVKGNRNIDENYWTKLRETPKLNAWRGYSFEQVCLSHIDQIKAALGISGVMTNVSSWRSKSEDNDTAKAQIDLIIARGDNVVNLCEIKYSLYEYEITNSYADKLRKKEATFVTETKTKSTIHTTFITTYGVKRNKHSGIVHSEVTMNELFV
jgi:AAA+ ATPase superfamily predicted ATPase